MRAMRKLTIIVCLSVLTAAIVLAANFDVNTWVKRGVYFQKKFKAKCSEGCVFNYDFVRGVWKQYREAVESLFDLAGVEADIYPGLKNKIVDACINKDPKYNYCEKDNLGALVKCIMPIMKPFLPRLIDLAKEYIETLDSVYDSIEPEIEKWFDALKC